MISRMRILSSPQTVACALNIMVVTIATYSSPNRSVPELHELLKSGAEIDPLKEFAEAAREELRRHPSRPQGLRLPYRPPPVLRAFFCPEMQTARLSRDRAGIFHVGDVTS